MNLFCTISDNWKKVPVIWASAERAYQIKHNKDLRDASGALIPPIISINRTDIVKDPKNKGIFQSNLSPNQDRYVVTKIMNQDKTSAFAGSKTVYDYNKINFKTAKSKQNKKIVYQSYFVPIPVYVTVNYEIAIFTSYQQQMNEILQPFITRRAQNYFIISDNHNRYECFMEPNFEQEKNDDLSNKERTYKSTIKVKTLGNLIGEGNNQEESDMVIKENIVEVKYPRERIVLDPSKEIT